MIKVILFAVVGVFGVVYAVLPEKFLARKYRGEEIPELALRTARVVGVFVALVGVLMALNSL